MTAHPTPLDHVAMSIHLRVDASPSDDSFKATIHVAPIDLVVEVTERDVRVAIHAAADRCAKRLRDQGYPVSAAEVLDSLDAIDGAPDGTLRPS